MCGLTGFVDFNKNSSAEILKTMTDTLTHRGPDDSGFEMPDHPDAQIGLGHRRLSILDLSPLGHQPMHFQELSIVYNGEVYNFREVRPELEKKGYSFVSDCDTEVILKAFHCWGPDCVHRFTGMFAFLILDRRDDTVYAFRDRAGVKPFYYYWKDGCFLYTSELKSLHKHPAFVSEPDLDSAALFLQYSYIPAPYCIFKHTRKLLPGHFLKLKLKTRELEEKVYWDVFDAYNKPKLKISDADAIDQTEKLLKQACEYRMVADVPVGVFLSGGYDSVAVASQLQSGRSSKIKTFTIGFHEKEFNEAEEAKKVAGFLGTEHTEYYCTAKEAADIIPKIPIIYDEPFSDNSVVPTILVSRLARQQVTVALSADGGDEIFAGYNKFNQSVRYTSMPGFMQAALGAGMGMVHPGRVPFLRDMYNFDSRFIKMRNIWKSRSPLVAMKNISQYITEDETRDYLAAPFETRETFFDAGHSLNDGNDWINKMLAIDYKTFLVDNNLVKVDRATMSVSLEGREPLLDHHLIEFLAQLPSNLKIRDGVNKYLLKQIVHKLVPEELMKRPKKPFIAPLTVWFRDELRELFLHYLDKDRLAKEGIFNPEKVVALRDRYLDGKKVTHQKLWNMLIFNMWKEHWVG